MEVANMKYGGVTLPVLLTKKPAPKVLHWTDVFKKPGEQ
jgi:hypothetical protein